MIDPTMTSEDIFNVLIMQSPLLRTHCMETMRSAMAVEHGNLPPILWKEQELPLQTLQSNERILGQDILTVGKRWETSKPESRTGIELLSMVLGNLASAGLLNEVSVDIISNDSGSDIRGITLLFRSSTETRSPATSGERTQSILTPMRSDIGTLGVKPRSVTDLPPIPGQ